jgi:hypothetical protein
MNETNETNETKAAEAVYFEAKYYVGEPIVTSARVARGSVHKTLDKAYSSKTNTLEGGFLHWEAMEEEEMVLWCGVGRIVKAVYIEPDPDIEVHVHVDDDGDRFLLKLQLGEEHHGRTTLWVRSADLKGTAKAETASGRQDAINILGNDKVSEAMVRQVRDHVAAKNQQVKKDLAAAFAAIH